MSIVPNYEQTVQFLEIFRPQGPHLLTAIPVEGGYTKTERFESTLGVEEWCVELNPDYGLYYHIGIPREGIARRMSKPLVEALDYLWVDIDPTPESSRTVILERLTDSVPDGVPQRPALIVDSGGGFQALWRLNAPILLHDSVDIEEAERLTRFLVLAYQGDQQAWNVDRLLRLPGTINYPNKTKRDKGRVPSLSQFRAMSKGTSEQIGFAKAPPPKPATGADPPSIKIKGPTLTYDPKTLPEGLGKKWSDLLINGEESWHYGDVGYPSRSEMVMGATRFMLERGMEHQVIYDILLSPDLAISNHIYAQPDLHRYGKRQIARCLESMEKPPDAPVPMEFIYDNPKKGTPQVIRSLLHNAIVAVRKLDITCEYNEMTDIMLINGKPFEDYLVTKARARIEAKYKVTFSQGMMKEVLAHLCQENAINPILDYINNLPKWDGEKRLSNWLMDYCGAEGTAFNRAVGRIVLIAAIKRIRQPGCKFDEMLILEGEQGDGKSNLLGKGLVPNSAWFTDHITMDKGPKEFIEDTYGHWIVECSELVTMRRAQIESLKALLSRGVDKARMAYARSRVDRPRRFIIFGSTNQRQYLIDDTGNRRFWPVATSGDLNKKVALLAANRDQLWAEAAEAETNRESIRLDEKYYDDARREQELRQVDNPLMDPIGKAIGGMDGLLKSGDILNHLGIELRDHSKHFRQLSLAMKTIGFTSRQLTKNGQNSKFWQRGKNDPRNNIVLKYEERI